MGGRGGGGGGGGGKLQRSSGSDQLQASLSTPSVGKQRCTAFTALSLHDKQCLQRKIRTWIHVFMFSKSSKASQNKPSHPEQPGSNKTIMIMRSSHKEA